MALENMIPVIVEHQLKFELLDPGGSEVVDVIDFEDVFSLLDLVHTNPALAMKLLLKFKFGFNRIYLHYRDQHERAKIELNDYEYQLRDKYSCNDTRNPLYGEKKLTQAVIEAAIKKEEGWKALNEKVKEIESYKMHIGSCKDIIAETLQTAQSFVSNPLQMSTDAEDMSEEDLEGLQALAERFANG